MANREWAKIPIELVQTRHSLILKFKEIAPVLFLNSVEAFLKIRKSMTNSNGFEPSYLYQSECTWAFAIQIPAISRLLRNNTDMIISPAVNIFVW